MKSFCLSLSFIFLASCAKAKYLNPSLENLQNKPGTELVQIEWLVEPNTATSSDFLLHFSQPQNEVKVSLWMPAMGHGSSPVQIEKLDTENYKVTSVWFIMPGDWDVRVNDEAIPVFVK